MEKLTLAPRDAFAKVRFVLTDMDETLTYKGRLAARTYDAMERLQGAGIKVIPVTAAPAGWCDQMARMWPIDGVIGENGGLFFQRGSSETLVRRYWHDDAEFAASSQQLADIGSMVRRQFPDLCFADDQPFRLTTIAFKRTTASVDAAVVAALRDAGAEATTNNLWILGWLGSFDKLTMSRRIMNEIYGLDLDASRDQILYSGDSTNDAPMFSFFRHTVGVSTVLQYLPELPVAPAWITDGPGGEGFVQVVEAILSSSS